MQRRRSDLAYLTIVGLITFSDVSLWRTDSSIQPYKQKVHNFNLVTGRVCYKYYSFSIISVKTCVCTVVAEASKYSTFTLLLLICWMKALKEYTRCYNSWPAGPSVVSICFVWCLERGLRVRLDDNRKHIRYWKLIDVPVMYIPWVLCLSNQTCKWKGLSLDDQTQNKLNMLICMLWVLKSACAVTIECLWAIQEFRILTMWHLYCLFWLLTSKWGIIVANIIKVHTDHKSWFRSSFWQESNYLVQINLESSQFNLVVHFGTLIF